MSFDSILVVAIITLTGLVLFIQGLRLRRGQHHHRCAGLHKPHCNANRAMPPRRTSHELRSEPSSGCR